MKINEVCNVTGLTKKAIDYYQQKEIIDPKFDESGYREFNESEIERLKQVSVFRSLVLSVSEIKKEYYQNLLKANEIFIERFPDFT